MVENEITTHVNINNKMYDLQVIECANRLQHLVLQAYYIVSERFKKDEPYPDFKIVKKCIQPILYFSDIQARFKSEFTLTMYKDVQKQSLTLASEIEEYNLPDKQVYNIIVEKIESTLIEFNRLLNLTIELEPTSKVAVQGKFMLK